MATITCLLLSPSFKKLPGASNVLFQRSSLGAKPNVTDSFYLRSKEDILRNTKRQPSAPVRSPHERREDSVDNTQSLRVATARNIQRLTFNCPHIFLKALSAQVSSVRPWDGYLLLFCQFGRVSNFFFFFKKALSF